MSKTYWGLVEEAAHAHPERIVLVDDYGRSLTNAELRDAAERTAAALAQRGIGDGTVVSWQLPTTLETMVVMVALTRLGAVQNPVLPIWRESEVRFVTAQLGTEVIIVPGVWRGFDHVALADELARDQPMTLVVVDHAAPMNGLRLPAGDPSSLPAPPTVETLPRWVYYSSGTTAAPKGVRHCDRSVIAGSAGVIGMVGATSDDVNPIAFPVSHIGGAAMLRSRRAITARSFEELNMFAAIPSPPAFVAERTNTTSDAAPRSALFCTTSSIAALPWIVGIIVTSSPSSARYRFSAAMYSSAACGPTGIAMLSFSTVEFCVGGWPRVPR